MAIRLVVTITAAPGKGSELAQAYKARCAEVMQEPGCEQFEGSSAKTTLSACKAGIGKFHHLRASVEFISFTECALIAQNALKFLTGLV
jgi:NAD-dependent oxidoreductase involved in siderophore biosynthesis